MITWFRIAAIRDMPEGPKEVLHGQVFALHVWPGYALHALVALHILGALKHQFLDREAELRQMGLGTRAAGRL